MTIVLLASVARAQEVDGRARPLNAPPEPPPAEAPLGRAEGLAPADEAPQLGVPINEAEVRDALLGRPREEAADPAGAPPAAPGVSDRAPFTPPATSELGRAGQGLDPVRPLSPNAARGVQLTPWLRVQPWVRNTTFYDSNIFRSPEGEEVRDIEVTNTAAVDVTASSRRLELDIGYAATLRTWVDQGETVDEHRARARFAAVGRVLSARARADAALLSRTDDPRFTGAAADRLILDGGASLSIALSRNVSLVPEGFASMQDFSDELDRNDHRTYGGNALVALSPGGRVTVLLGGGARELIYTSDAAIAPDLRIYSAIVGLELRLRRLTGQVRVGYDWSDVLERRQFPEDQDAPKGFTAAVTLAGQLTRLTTVSVDLTRAITFSTTTAPVWVSRIGLSVTQQLLLRLAGTARVQYELYESTDSDVDDASSVLGALGLAWEPRPWLLLGVEGSYLTRDGGGAGGLGGDFDVFRVGATVTLRF